MVDKFEYTHFNYTDNMASLMAQAMNMARRMMPKEYSNWEWCFCAGQTDIMLFDYSENEKYDITHHLFILFKFLTTAIHVIFARYHQSVVNYDKILLEKSITYHFYTDKAGIVGTDPRRWFMMRDATNVICKLKECLWGPGLISSEQFKSFKGQCRKSDFRPLTSFIYNKLDNPDTPVVFIEVAVPVLSAIKGVMILKQADIVHIPIGACILTQCDVVGLTLLGAYQPTVVLQNIRRRYINVGIEIINRNFSRKEN